MIELAITPALNLSLISTLFMIRAGCFACVLGGCLLIAPIFSLRGNVSGSVIVLGVFLIIAGFVFTGISTYAITELSKDRPYQTTAGKTFTTSDYQNISSLADSQSYSMSGGGSFFLGIGSVSVNGQTTPQYVFYKILPDGYQLGTLPANNVIIREDATSGKANIEWVYQHVISDKTEYLDNNETWGGVDSVSLYKTYIHVPDGTVKVQYNLDSELGK